MGKDKAISRQENLVGLKVSAAKIFPGTKIGDSIAVNGVCLTVTRLEKPGILCFDIMQETILKSTLKDLAVGSGVNLERALKANSRFGGHFVSGHVDGVGVIRKIIRQANYVEFELSLPRECQRFVVPKGSVTIDGVSLTVGRVSKKSFSVYLIPHTLNVTMLGMKKERDRLNLEVDLLARYLLGRG